MRVSIFLVFIVGVLVSHSNAYSAGRCEISIGDKVSFRDPVEVYESMQGMQLVKDEFETTAAFKKRVAEVESTFNNESILLRGTYWRSNTKYDADNSRIVMTEYAWQVGFFDSSEVHGIESESGYDNINHEIGLKYDEQTIGTFTAFNAYGASIEVYRVLRVVYGVFDRSGVSDYRTWRSEINVEGEFGFNEPAVLIPMPIDEAKRVISNLQVGVSVTPKKPFTAKGKKQLGPTIDIPKELNVIYHTIVADINCVVIADDKGRVLKTVEIAY